MNEILSKQQTRDLISQNNITNAADIKNVLKSMFKNVIQEMLEGEMDSTLGYGKYDRDYEKDGNYRNGYTNKNVITELGELNVDVPRDRNGDFEPKIVPKRQRDISGIEEQIISLYARGMTTRDIHDQMQDLYGVEVSADMVSRITDKIIPEIKEWQNRPLEALYSFIFMDAIHYKVRTEGRVINRAAYVVVGINKEGMKDVLGIWIGENESSKFWLGVLTQLKNRGVKDVLIFSVDGLSGFEDAIVSAYPNSEIQRCIIHQLRNTLKYVPHKDKKALAADFRELYNAPTEELALDKLDLIESKWGKKYPSAISSWKTNWGVLSTFFKYPEEIRRIMYTTNIIEGLNRQYRKVTKSKTIFPTDISLQKMLYLATINIVEKWTMRYKDWDKVINHFCVLYGERIKPYL